MKGQPFAVRANQRSVELARNLYGLAQTERDVALELVALYKTVGGGWEATGREERRGNERS